MNALLIGSGAREHAIAWKLRQSPRIGALYAAPGNAGIAQLADIVELRIPKAYAAPADAQTFLDAASSLVRRMRIDLVIVGPEDPLSLGLTDRLRAEGVAVFGPTRAAAQIESSKAFAKDLMERHGVPMGVCAKFDDFEAARRYVESRLCDVVVKADGLAAGKGAIVTRSHDEAIDAHRELLVHRALGPAAATVVIEDKLTGRETSAHAFTDGRTVVHMPFACDHKAIFDGDRGPNTGGMGAYSPAAWLPDSTADAIRANVTEATLRAMATEGVPFSGALFPGIMVTADGPKVLEFNARLGDPETEVLLPRLESDLFEIMLATASGSLDRIDVRWSEDAAVTVMLASDGYPGPYEVSKPIEGLDGMDPGVTVFHAGTKLDASGRTVTAGGRVLAVTAVAPTIADARERVYRNIARIQFDGMHYRSDIGASAIPAAV